MCAEASNATLERVLSGKAEMVGALANKSVLEEGGTARQALAGVPVTARQVAQRAARAAR